MKTIIILISGLLWIGSEAEVFSVAKCENLFYNTSRNSERVVIEACSEAWGAMYDREYYPNY